MVYCNGYWVSTPKNRSKQTVLFQIEDAIPRDADFSLFAIGNEFVRCKQIANTKRTLGRNGVSYCIWSCDLIFYRWKPNIDQGNKGEEVAGIAPL